MVKNYPAVAYAVLDMPYNLGLTKLNKFVKLNAAPTAKDRAKAATESHRNGIHASRNNGIKAWIESAI